MIKVSIITVCYNSVKTIRETLDSVNNQSYTNIEHIIIDGKSSDGTIELIQESIKGSKKSIVFISEKDSGIYDAMNKGIKKSTGDIIGFLNSDDIFFSNCAVEEIVHEFNTSTIDGIYGNLIYIGKKDSNQIIRYWESKNPQELKFIQGDQIPHPTFYVKKEIFENFGVFNTTLKIAADYELIIRFLHKYNIQTKHINKPIIKMRAGGESNRSIANILKGNREILYSLKVNGLRVNFFVFYLNKVKTKVRELFAITSN